MSFLYIASDNISLQSMPHELTKSEREAIFARINGLGDAGEEEMRSFDHSRSARGRPSLFVKQGYDILVGSYAALIKRR